MGAMGIAIKVDGDLPGQVAALLNNVGHDAKSVSQQGLSGAPDADVWHAAQTEGRCLFTADKGFANARSYPPGTHGGIVLLRLPRESREGYMRLAESLLEKVDLQSAAGAIVVVTPTAVRFHRGN